jgi:hypothetical protein
MEPSQAMHMHCDIMIKYNMAMQLSDKYEEKPLRLKDVSDLSDELYDWANNNTDLDRAIAAYEAAVRLMPDGHQCQTELLSQLGISLLQCFQHLGNITDIDNAIFVLEGTLILTPDGHTDKPAYLSNLGNVFFFAILSVLVTWQTVTRLFPLMNKL